MRHTQGPVNALVGQISTDATCHMLCLPVHRSEVGYRKDLPEEEPRSGFLVDQQCSCQSNLIRRFRRARVQAPVCTSTNAR